MKTKLLLTLVILMGSLRIASADHFSSLLRLSVAGNSRYAVSIDNGPFTAPGRDFDFDRLRPGYHRIYVIRLGGSSHAYGYTPFFGRAIFDGDVLVPSAAAVTALIDRGCLRILRIDDRFDRGCRPGCHENDHHHGSGGHCATPVPAYDDFFQEPVSQVEFDEIRRAVSQRPFESTRVEIACRLMQDRFFTAGQVAQLVGLFEFESNRMQVAKAAYARTVDRNRYYVVFDVLAFDSSVRELMRFMETYG
ncbi:MAG: hypothetical protein RL021_1102 [Bacteroidota bacterium]